MEADRRITFERLRRRVLFLVMRRVLRWSGFDSARPIGAFLGALQYCFDSRTRQTCLEGIAALLGRKADDPQVAAIARSAFRVNTMAVLEVLSMVDRKLDAQRLHARCRVDGLENLRAARNGRGAILLATHSGNSLLLAAQLADAGWPVTIVYRRARMMSLEFFVEGLPRYGFDGILANEGFRAYARMVDALRHDRVLFAMMDQGVKDAETGVPLRFLGKDMPMPGGVVQLARQTRAPIVPVTSLAADPVWHFAIGPRLSLPPGGSIEEDTAAVLRHVEAQILAHPELWSWHHRRWRNFPVAATHGG
ncbi:MAG TPA: lysophospholipid acyltransferase family protein [Steroidobacteraceae bacterium]|nr:lysophospholipid acyltransferase family protein [Steroidobacteraceae bacterium]